MPNDTPRKTNMTGWKPNYLKMYRLSIMVIFHCHVSFGGVSILVWYNPGLVLRKVIFTTIHWLFYATKSVVTSQSCPSSTKQIHTRQHHGHEPPAYRTLCRPLKNDGWNMIFLLGCFCFKSINGTCVQTL